MAKAITLSNQERGKHYKTYRQLKSLQNKKTAWNKTIYNVEKFIQLYFSDKLNGRIFISYYSVYFRDKIEGHNKAELDSYTKGWAQKKA